MKTGISLTNCQTTIDSKVKEAIDGIWDVYARKFGNKFRSSIIADDRDYMIWYVAIKGLVKSDIERGKRSLITWSGDSWFPNEKEFRIMCMGIDDSYIKKLKQLTLRWSYLSPNEFEDTLEFRRAKWILTEMARDDVSHYYKTQANHKKADDLFNQYFNLVIAIGYDDLPEISLMLEQKKEVIDKEKLSGFLQNLLGEL